MRTTCRSPSPRDGCSLTPELNRTGSDMSTSGRSTSLLALIQDADASALLTRLGIDREHVRVPTPPRPGRVRRRGATRKLETGSDFDTFPTWSPRGDWIAFTSKRDGDYEIYRIRPDGTDLQRLPRSPGNDAHPAFSPDGEWIAFATARQGFKDEAVGLLLAGAFQPYGELAVMRADGSDVRMLTDNSTEEGAPSWVSRRHH